jgi:hypothetical protein
MTGAAQRCFAEFLPGAEEYERKPGEKRPLDDRIKQPLRDSYQAWFKMTIIRRSKVVGISATFREYEKSRQFKDKNLATTKGMISKWRDDEVTIEKAGACVGIA